MDIALSRKKLVGDACVECGGNCDTCTCLPEAERPVSHPRLLARVREDIQTVFSKDPAARTTFEVLTCYPGLHALWMHRLSHALWCRKRRLLARLVSHIGRWMTGVEIHPGARIGRRVFIDHGMGVVIGETSEIGDDVLIYKGVVLGGVSLEKTKRHPTIRNGVILGSNVTVLGPIEVGENSRVGSGSVVVKPVPACATVVGVPGRVVKINGVSCYLKPDLHHENLPDVTVNAINQLTQRIEALESRLHALSGDGVLTEDDLVLEEVESWL